MTTSGKKNLHDQNSNEKNKSIYFFVVFVVTSFILAFILGGYFIGKEKADSQKVLIETKSKID